MIEVNHLTKRYGTNTALNDVSFSIEKGTIVGFLGPNGAGKSTTMNIITGYLSASSGTVTVGGFDILDEANEAKKLIGYLPEFPPLYADMTVREYLDFMYGLKKVKLPKEKHIKEICRLVKIENVYNRLIGNLSKGYKQRVGIAQALLGTPEIVILDEPTVGLDPLQILEIRSLIASLGRSRTVLISSHILSEVQTMCSKILIIAHGKLVAFDAPEKLEERLAAPGEITITAETDAQRARTLVEALPGVAGITVKADGPDRSQLAVASGTEDIYALSRSIFQTFADSGCALCELGVKKPSLEDIFLELTEGGETP